MRAAIRKWGNSLALRIPRALAESAGIAAGSEVEIALSDGRIVVEPVDPRDTLESLLAQVTPENRHAEVRSGPATGEEAW